MNHTPAGKMNGVFRLVVILASAGLFGNTAAFAQTSAAAINPCTPWPATNALGRKLPMPDEVGPPQAGRFVGILYSPWHDHHYGKPGSGEGPTDISKLLARDPDLLRKPESPLWKGYWACYWGEPLFGYYSCTDPWVLRRHANLLADAGIDTLIFDVTNAQNYPDVYHKMGEVFQQMRGQGDRTPQIAFMLNTKAGESAAALPEPLPAGPLSRPVVPLARQAADAVRPGGGQPRTAAVLHLAAPIGRTGGETRPSPGTGKPSIRSLTATPTTPRGPSR